MKTKQYILTGLCIAAMILTGCGAKKKAVTGQKTTVEQTVPTWHTCIIQGAQATFSTPDDKISAAVTMQTVRDSMIVVSVMPMFGLEMMRLEATPTELIAINKIQGQYAKTTYAELNRKLTPALNWDVLQQLCTAELPTGPDKARLVYTFGKDQFELVVNYSPRRIDVPVKVNNQPLNRYQQIDISKWL